MITFGVSDISSLDERPNRQCSARRSCDPGIQSQYSGKFPMMDHAMARMAKGLMATFAISGPENAALMHPGPAPDSRSGSPASVWQG